MSPSVTAYVHSTTNVIDKNVDNAIDAVKAMDDTLSFYFNVSEGYRGLYESELFYKSGNSRNSWLHYAEDELYQQGYLTSDPMFAIDAAHIIIFGGSSVNGAGWSQWNVGAEESEGGYNGAKSYRSYAGDYGFAHINTASDLTSDYYDNTVMHELGHLFNLKHYHGSITNRSGDMYASPMITWYAEDGCYVTDNSPPNKDLCWDDSGNKHACNHWQALPNCTTNQMENWHSANL